MLPRIAHTLTMPRSPTLKTYSRLFLENLSRSQIQTHAKRHSIRANGKTEAIISQLLGKEIISDEVPAPTVGRSIRPSTCRNRIKAADAGTTERAAGIMTVQNPTSSIEHVISYRRPTPYPQSRSGSESSSNSGRKSTYGDYPPAPISQAQTKAVPMKQTDRDIRVVHRKLAELVNQQVSLQRELDNVNTLLKYSHQDMTASAKRIDHLSWVRQATEEVVMLDLKDVRHIWDRTGRMGEKDKEAWQQFVEENWMGPPRWKPEKTEAVVESDSSSVASSLEDPDAEYAESGGQEVLENDGEGVPVVYEKDDEDSIYV